MKQTTKYNKLNNHLKVKYTTNTNGKAYVGMTLSEKNEMIVFLPIGYEIENELEEKNKTTSEIKQVIYETVKAQSDELKEEIRKLFTFLSKKINSGYVANAEENDFDLVSAIKIIENYIQYGLYTQTQNETKKNSSGRVNWQKTIHEKQVYLPKKTIYQNIYHNKINYNAELEIQNIQKICLNQISKTIGIYWGIYINENVKEYYNKNEMIYILQNEIKSVNQDKKLEVLNNLLNYLKNANFEKIKQGKISFKYKEFEYIWQNLVDIKGIKGNEKHNYQPIAAYYRFDETVKHKVNPSLPDTIVIDDEKKLVFILDAKYYKIGNLPNEYDIFKQTRYGEYVKTVLKKEGKADYDIINSFVLPKNLSKEKVIVEDYYARLNESKDLVEITKENSYKMIFVTYVDVRNLINNTKDVMQLVEEELIKSYKQNIIK